MKVCCMIVLLVVFYTSERPVKKQPPMDALGFFNFSEKNQSLFKPLGCSNIGVRRS